MSNLSVWILASRPKTLWAAISPVLIGIAMAFADGAGHMPSALAALFGAVMIQIGTNFANDYYDFKKGSDTSDRLGPTRVTQAGMVTPSAMRAAIFVAFLLAFLAGIYLVYRGGWPIVVIGLSSILFGILYTAGPYPLSYTGWADIFVLVFFGPVAVGGTYYVQSLQISWPVVLAGLAPGLFSVAILTVNNLRDIDNDRRSGKRTLPARFGRTFARWEYVVCMFAGTMIAAVVVVTIGVHYYALAALAVLVASIPSVRTVFASTDGPTLNNTLAATGKLLLLYSVLFSVGWLL